MLYHRYTRPASLALCLLSFLSAPVTADDVLVQAEQLLNQKRGQEAFALLSPLEDERAGDPGFDFLLGRAALANGRNTEAAFAFERCLAVDPKNGPCRMQMAQTHMLLGENDQARLELKTIQEYSPPPEVETLVSQYMGMLDEKDGQAKRQVSAYAQLGLGYDTNVNSATDQSQIAIPALGGLYFVYDSAAREQEDSYAQLEAGARLRQSLTPAWSLLADAGVSQRLHQDVDGLNSLALDASVGGAWRTGPSQIVLRANAQNYQLDGDDYRKLVGGMGQYIYSPRDSSQLSAYLQVTDMSYDGQPSRDARRDTLGAAWSQALDWWRNPVVYAGLYGGQETPETGDVKYEHFGQQFFGVRVGGSLALGARTQLNGAISTESRDYDAEHPYFLTTRSDSQIDVNLGLAYRLGKYLSVRPNYTFTSNDSNIVINEFSRHTLSVDIRYER
ncbi:MAG TPA: hypothetical protein DF427_05970 [Moraxellaceae bacterium]|nr:hypothetical protein [Moraxellaceae bacterium]